MEQREAFHVPLLVVDVFFEPQGDDLKISFNGVNIDALREWEVFQKLGGFEHDLVVTIYYSVSFKFPKVEDDGIYSEVWGVLSEVLSEKYNGFVKELLVCLNEGIALNSWLLKWWKLKKVFQSRFEEILDGLNEGLEVKVLDGHAPRLYGRGADVSLPFHIDLRLKCEHRIPVRVLFQKVTEFDDMVDSWIKIMKEVTNRLFKEDSYKTLVGFFRNFIMSEEFYNELLFRLVNILYARIVEDLKNKRVEKFNKLVEEFGIQKVVEAVSDIFYQLNECQMEFYEEGFSVWIERGKPIYRDYKGYTRTVWVERFLNLIMPHRADLFKEIRTFNFLILFIALTFASQEWKEALRNTFGDKTCACLANIFVDLTRTKVYEVYSSPVGGV